MHCSTSCKEGNPRRRRRVARQSARKKLLRRILEAFWNTTNERALSARQRWPEAQRITRAAPILSTLCFQQGWRSTSASPQAVVWARPASIRKKPLNAPGYPRPNKEEKKLRGNTSPPPPAAVASAAARGRRWGPWPRLSDHISDAIKVVAEASLPRQSSPAAAVDEASAGGEGGGPFPVLGPTFHRGRSRRATCCSERPPRRRGWTREEVVGWLSWSRVHHAAVATTGCRPSGGARSLVYGAKANTRGRAHDQSAPDPSIGEAAADPRALQGRSETCVRRLSVAANPGTGVRHRDGGCGQAGGSA